MKANNHFINIVGIDGSGKTTLCKYLVDELNKNELQFKYVHSYHEPFLLKPFKTVAKLIFMRGTDEFKEYTRYRKRKAEASGKHKVLSRLYIMIWVLDYMLQLFFHIGLPKLLGKHLIVDRYVFDVVLNASLTADFSLSTSYKIIDMLLKILPKPDVVFIIDLPEEVAFSRKDDIQSVDYLRERRHLYLKMADRYRFLKLDGQLNPQTLLTQAINVLI